MENMENNKSEINEEETQSDLKAYLINTDQIQDTIVFAEDLACAETKIEGTGTRMKVMDWIPIRTKHPEVFDNSKWFLVEYLATGGADKGKTAILLAKARSLTEASQICGKKVPKSFEIQGIESIDLDIVE